jgi:hypothetical protein
VRFKASYLIKAMCLWTFFVWGVLIKNMVTMEDETLGFRLVHIGLALVSIAFAAAVWPFAKQVDKHRPPV